jgi:uncharacterized membrane protein
MARAYYDDASDCEDVCADSEAVRRARRLVNRHVRRTGAPGSANGPPNEFMLNLALFALVLGHFGVIIGFNLGGSTQSFVNGSIIFVSMFGTYLITDLIWVFTFEMPLPNTICHRKLRGGIIQMIKKYVKMDQKHEKEEPGAFEVGILILFFFYATAANFVCVVLPTLDHSDYNSNTIRYVIGKAFTLGCFAYVNLFLITAAQIKNYPALIFGIAGFSGGVLSVGASVVGVVVGFAL